jgi:DNA end-binding protein Ku
MRRKKQEAKPKTPRGVWKGFIAFGLVNIPIVLQSAEQDKKIHFRLIDRHDYSPIGYRQVNKATGKEVRRDSIVKGYEYEKGRYVLMSDADFKKANVKATDLIEIEDFVDLAEIDPMLFEKPYYIVPGSGGEKGYVLLREALKKTNRAAIAKAVLHTVQHLVAIMPKEDYLILEILRFANEIKEVKEVELLNEKTEKMRVSDKELQVAEQLVEGMTGEWDPSKYHDTYRDDIMKLVQTKIKKGDTAEVEEIAKSEEPQPTNVVDLTALLKKSLDATRGKKKRGA